MGRESKIQPTLAEDLALIARVEAAGGLSYGNTMCVLRELGIRYIEFNRATNRVLAQRVPEPVSKCD